MSIREVNEVMAEVKSDLPEVLKRWQEKPWEFCADVLRAEPLEWQVKFMNAVSLAKRGLPNSPDGSCKTRFAIKSGTGVGKTFTVAALILWGLACFPDTKIPVTAPTSPQLKAVLWPELAKWINNIPPGLKSLFPFEHQTDRINMLDNFAVARTARDESPESFQGYHASSVMLVADEASGVGDPIFLAGQGVMAEKGAVTILIGNPTRASGFFFNCFNSPFWWTMTVSCADSPRVTKQYIEEMRQEHGENSYEFQVRVLGCFHLEESGVIIPYPWVKDAIDKDVGPDSDYIVWGFDVSDGRDRSALAKRCGNRLMEVKSWGGKEALVSVGVVVDEYYATPLDKRPDEICVDAIGMGATAAQRLAEVLKTDPVVISKVNVAITGAKVGPRFTSHRVELWDRGRKWFESNMVRIPAGAERFYKQISSVEWEVKDSNGKWSIVDKHVSGTSPDEGDAFLLTFSGLKRGISCFTKDSKGRKLKNMGSVMGIGSASYLPSNIDNSATQGAVHDTSFFNWHT